MGCTNSKHKRCHKCKAPYSPSLRSNSMHIHHAPPQTDHVVALTSTTFAIRHHDDDSGDSLTFTNGNLKIYNENKQRNEKKEEFSMGLIEAKTWSNMIEQKITKVVTPMTPTKTPPGEPQTIINTWELMEGLEDTSPFRFRSISFDSNADVNSPKPPMFVQITQEDESKINSAISEFDPKVLSSFIESFVSNPAIDNKFEKNKVVFYFTSLRGVRKTYEDCCKVMSILKGLGVRVDERDVSMHSEFKEELKELLGDGYGVGGGLPRVFVGRDYIGGAEEIQKLHENGKLEKLFVSCDKIEENGTELCEACGDIRFVACENCYGSRKIYRRSDDDDDDDGVTGRYGFQCCPHCNENGLIRCPVCCY
ncbi:putative thioredoxin-like protein [Lupinus albus]|uniref:Putative thioredoxin-like protein n=1 Tax=Lupinus albus TaxID=3870 RepID=A0A6A4PU97_LUPAL|nr:putative thioredoxin-like protein [Lupinus albus]